MKKIPFFGNKTDHWSVINKQLVLILFLIIPILGNAQTDVLKTYIEKGLESNLSIKQENLNINKSLEALREAKGLFLPKVTFSASYTLATGGRAIEFPIGDLLNPVYNTLNALTQTNNFPLVENEQITFLPNNFQETKVRVIQPIYNSDIYYNQKAKEALISVQQAKKEAYEQELTKEIKIAYYKYLQSLEAIEIYKATKKLLQEIQRTNEKLVKHQKATRDVIFNAKYELQKIESEITNANKNSELAKAYFNFLINRDLNEEIVIDKNIKPTEEAANEQALSENAVKQRKEVQQLKSAMVVNEQVVKLNEAKRLPTAAFVTDLGFQGNGYRIWEDQAFVFANISLSWDIFTGFQNEAKVQQAKIDQDILSNQYLQLQQQIQLQVKQAYFELKSSQEQVKTAKSALVNAKEGFRLIKKQYENGTTFFFRVVQAQTNMTTAQLTLSIAEFDILVKQAELDYASGK